MTQGAQKGEAIRRAEDVRGKRGSRLAVATAGLAAALVLGGATDRASAIVIPWGTMSGGVGVHYNDNGVGENGVTNVAYFRAQAAKDPHNVVDQNLGVVGTSLSGAPFAFDSSFDLGGGLTLAALLDDVGQYAVDLVLIAPTNDDTAPIPQLKGFTRTDGFNVVHFPPLVAGDIGWAFNDYQGLGSPGSYISVGDLNGDMTIDGSDQVVQTGTGPTNVDTVVNSAFRGNIVNLTFSNVMQSGPIFTATISGELISDGNFYPFAPGQSQLGIASLGLTGRFFFTGSLSYDSTGDTGLDLVDFYAGTLTFTAEAFPPTELTLSSLRLRYDNATVDNGKAKFKALLDDNDSQTLEADLIAGNVSVQIIDNGQFNLTLPLTGCQLRAHGRIRCLSVDRRTRARFFPTKQGPFIYNVQVSAKSLSSTETGSVQPSGPVVVSINQSGGPSRVDLISDCSAPAGKKYLSCLEP